MKFSAMYVTTAIHDFYCRTAFGIRDNDNEQQQTIRKKAKYGNPTDDFGQPAIGGLTNIDQRQLNRIYCESVRQRVVQDELIQTIRHTIQENPGLTIGEFGPILTRKFRKIYPLFFYIAHIQHGGFQQAAVLHNGNCSIVTDQGKLHVILCYTPRSFLIWPRGTTRKIRRTVVERLQTLGVSLMIFCFSVRFKWIHINLLL